MCVFCSAPCACCAIKQSASELSAHHHQASRRGPKWTQTATARHPIKDLLFGFVRPSCHCRNTCDTSTGCQYVVRLIALLKSLLQNGSENGDGTMMHRRFLLYRRFDDAQLSLVCRAEDFMHELSSCCYGYAKLALTLLHE